MEDPQDARFNKLETPLEKGFAKIKAELKDAHRRLDVKDTQIAAFIERLTEMAFQSATTNYFTTKLTA